MNPTTAYTPPPGFARVTSHLEGITVYAPRPAEDPTPEAREFKCPQCGATTGYAPSAASVVCQHCGYAQSLASETPGQRAAEFEFTLENLALAARGWGADRRELHCDSCGADLSVAASASELSTTCPFCTSNRVVARVTSQESLRPRFLIPFKLEAKACLPRVRAWLGKGWMHPSDLGRAAASAQFRGVYLPFWTFDATIAADWRAEVGYERTERYYDAGSKSWKTRTRIDWRWESGHAQVSPNDLLGIGTTRISHILLARLYPFNLNKLAAYEPGFLAGWQALNYDIPLQAAWETVKGEMREQARQACLAQIHSVHVRNFAMQADFADETWRYILLPVFAAAYRFEDQSYQVLVNGQTGAVAGQKPIEWWKVWLAIAGLLTPGVLLALAGLVLLLAGGIGILPLGLGGVLFVIGVILAVIIFRQANEAGKI